MARLPNASVIQVLEIFRPVEIEEVRAGVLPVPFRHLEFQRQEVRHHNFGMLRGKFAEYAIIVVPEFAGVVLHVVPMDSVKPSCCPQNFIICFRSRGCVLVLKIAHAHAACNAFCDAVLEQLDVRDFSCFGKEVFYLAFGGKKIPIGAEFP